MQIKRKNFLLLTLTESNLFAHYRPERGVRAARELA